MTLEHLSRHDLVQLIAGRADFGSCHECGAPVDTARALDGFCLCLQCDALFDDDDAPAVFHVPFAAASNETRAPFHIPALVAAGEKPLQLALI